MIVLSLSFRFVSVASSSCKRRSTLFASVVPNPKTNQRAAFVAARSCTVSDSCCPIPDGGRARASKNDRDDRARRRRSRRPGDCRTKRAVVAMNRRSIAAKQKWSMK